MRCDNEERSMTDPSASRTLPAARTARAERGESLLLPALIRANRAYAEALHGAGILSEAEQKSIFEALSQVEKEVEADKLAITDSPLAALESRLAAIAKDVAPKLNLGRGRAEQMSTALRLWLLDELDALTTLIAGLQRALIQQAEKHVATLMPGYLNFRPVQVVSCSHWLLSYFWMLARDQERLSAVIGRASSSPLGSGLLAGAPYRLARHELAHALDFSDESRNSIDAVSDLDFCAEFLFAASLLGVHLNRLSDDLLMFANPLLGFVTIDPSYIGRASIGGDDRGDKPISGINGSSTRLLGQMTGFMAALRTLPAAFNADTPEARQTLFEASDLLRLMLVTLDGAVSTLTLHPDRMFDALEERILASDLMDYLVGRGETYQKTQQVLDTLFTRAENTGKPISDTELSLLQKESAAFDADVFALFDYSRSVAQRATIGGTAPAAIRSQIRQALNWLVEMGLE
jgi:argininosuccinate lyase